MVIWGVGRQRGNRDWGKSEPGRGMPDPRHLTVTRLGPSCPSWTSEKGRDMESKDSIPVGPFSLFLLHEGKGRLLHLLQMGLFLGTVGVPSKTLWNTKGALISIPPGRKVCKRASLRLGKEW